MAGLVLHVVVILPRLRNPNKKKTISRDEHAAVQHANMLSHKRNHTSKEDMDICYTCGSHDDTINTYGLSASNIDSLFLSLGLCSAEILVAWHSLLLLDVAVNGHDHNNHNQDGHQGNTHDHQRNFSKRG